MLHYMVGRFNLGDIREMREGLPVWTADAIADARAAGMTWAAIAGVLGVSVRTAHMLAQKRKGARG